MNRFRQILQILALGVTLGSALGTHAAPARGGKAQARRCALAFARTVENPFAVLQVPRDLVETYFIGEYRPTKVMKVDTGSNFYSLDKIDVKSVPTDRLNIEMVMRDFKLTRLQAVEVQALLRHHSSSPTSTEFLHAVDLVRSGHTLSRLNVDKVMAAPFTIVFDIDGTLLDQDSETFVRKVHEASFAVDGKKIHHVALNPGAINLIKKARELNGAVVLFSRNNDALIWEILRSMTFEGQALSQMVDGVLTSSHMTVPSAEVETYSEGPSYKLLKKDLSIIPSKRVILIDDDPEYVLQKHLTVEVEKFEISKVLVEPIRESDDTVPWYDSKFSWFKKSSTKEKKEAGSLTEKQSKRLDELLKRMQTEYEKIGRELEFLVSDITKFTKRQVAFSPDGARAMALLMGKDSLFYLEDHEAMTKKDALTFILENPNQIKNILKSKKRIETDWKRWSDDEKHSL